MAVGSSLKTGAEHDNHVANQPTLLGQRYLTDGRWNQDGDPTTADDSDTAYPASAAYDGNCGTMTRPASAQTIWYYIGWLPVTTLDAIFIHVLSGEGGDGTPRFSAQLLDAAFNALEIELCGSEWFICNKRLFVPDIKISGDSGNDQREFTAAVYVRLKFDCTVSGGDGRPQISEIITGNQRQLSRGPLYPYDVLNRNAMIQAHSSASGIITSITHFENKLDLRADFSLDGTAQRNQITSFWADIGGGARPFIWCPQPQSAQNTAWLMTSRKKLLELPRIEYAIWNWSLDTIEQGGYLLGDE